MSEIKLKAQKRELIGRKVKQLRQKGFLPANIYGKKISSRAVVLGIKEFEKVFAEVGETGVVQLTVEGEKEQRPILIQNVQVDPLTNGPLHVDLRQIILTEKVTANIPIELVGEVPAVAQKLGILIRPVSEIEVEALPMDLPEKFVIDVSKLANVGEEIKVSDIKIDKKIQLKVEGNLVVAKIEPLAAEEVVVPPPTVEGETPTEGEAPAEGGEQQAGEEAPAETPNSKNQALLKEKGEKE